jgi:hypothetical protein
MDRNGWDVYDTSTGKSEFVSRAKAENSNSNAIDTWQRLYDMDSKPYLVSNVTIKIPYIDLSPEKEVEVIEFSINIKRYMGIFR